MSSDGSIKKQIITESVSSHKDDVFNKTLQSMNENVESSVKAMSNQILSQINASLVVLSNNYDKTSEINKEAHENCVIKLKQELKDAKSICDFNHEKLNGLKNKLNEALANYHNQKLITKTFSHLKHFAIKSKTIKYSENIVVKSLIDRKKMENIIINWRNQTIRTKKEEVYNKNMRYFRLEQEKMEKLANEENSRLISILKQLEMDIAKEMEERRHLSKLYDFEMNKGADQFVNETQQFKDFNSSDVQAP